MTARRTLDRSGRAGSDPGPPAPTLEVVVPVHNEEAVLAANVGRLARHLTATMPFGWRITIADNASTDATLEVAAQLAVEHGGLRVLHLARKGRGRALRTAWSASDAEVVAYMDVDLSTDLDALVPLVAPLVAGGADIAIGSRLAPGASVVRGPRREVLSRGYNQLLRLVFGNRFRDAQCGFKALRSEVARCLLPEIEDEAWFFDTELLLLAERRGLRIVEVPVRWVDDPDSRVDVTRTVVDDLKGMLRMARRFRSERRLARRAALAGGVDQPAAWQAQPPPQPPATGAPHRPAPTAGWARPVAANTDSRRTASG